jgi:L-asparagine transporter-like permease
MKIGVICTLLALTGLIGQYLLYLLAFITEQGFIVGVYICFGLGIIGLILIAVTKYRLTFILEESHSLTIYKTIFGKIGLIALSISGIMLLFISMFYDPNEIIALVSFVLYCVGIGFCILAAINKKTLQKSKNMI